jgi:transposase InsO family protein
MNINRSSFYKWYKRIINPSISSIRKETDCKLLLEYHNKYPTHGHLWLKHKILLDSGLDLGNNYVHNLCKILGIKSRSRRYTYKSPGIPFHRYPNLVLRAMNINRPFEVIVSDMTVIKPNGVYYELTLYVDLFNNEIVSYSLSNIRGDRTTYLKGLNDVIKKKEEHSELELILHTDQGSVYSSKSFNELLPNYNIIRSMSRAGTPTDNGVMESINGWLKEELLLDFKLKHNDNIDKQIEDYIKYFNEARPAYALNYKTPKQVKDEYYEMILSKDNQIVNPMRDNCI